MTKKKSIWVLFGILVISTWAFGSATPALSETIKCNNETDIGKREIDQVLFTEFFVGSTTKEAAANCDNGETPTVKTHSVWASTVGKETIVHGYTIFTFKDSSKIVTQINYRQVPDPDGKAEWIWDGISEIIKGTLRFNGIKGNVSFKGKVLFPDRRSVNQWTINYNLPTK